MLDLVLRNGRVSSGSNDVGTGKAYMSKERKSGVGEIVKKCPLNIDCFAGTFDCRSI